MLDLIDSYDGNGQYFEESETMLVKSPFITEDENKDESCDENDADQSSSDSNSESPA
ncbi:MAG: hypothetical protein QM535_22560 [Limnohabitans sp.]|nr:hypothetical protein [Limnohabitans sp.]